MFAIFGSEFLVKSNAQQVVYSNNTHKSVPFQEKFDSVIATNNETLLFETPARSELDCTNACVLDPLCQTVAWEQGSRLCQGHSIKGGVSGPDTTPAGSKKLQIAKPCE